MATNSALNWHTAQSNLPIPRSGLCWKTVWWQVLPSPPRSLSHSVGVYRITSIIHNTQNSGTQVKWWHCICFLGAQRTLEHPPPPARHLHRTLRVKTQCQVKKLSTYLPACSHFPSHQESEQMCRWVTTCHLREALSDWPPNGPPPGMSW